MKLNSFSFIVPLIFGVILIPNSYAADTGNEPNLNAITEYATTKTPDILNREFGNISVSVKDYKNPKLSFNDYFCQPGNKVKYGSYHHFPRPQLYLDTQLMDFYAKDKKAKIECTNMTVEEFTGRTFIHELVHRYDKKHKLSSNKKFLSLVDAKRGKVRSQNLSTTPDSYEFKNVKESLAVNAEYFFFDQEYKCRRPSMYRFFKESFNFNPSSLDCRKYNYFLLNDSNSEANLTRMETLNYDKVHSIHYLWAGAGKEMMSKWGHAMLRIVVCAPFRKTVSDECMKDSRYHLVLSYRAHSSTPTMNTMNGLVGKLPSQLFIYKLRSIIEEYTMRDFRDLYSVPLDLSKDEIEAVLDLSLDRYWNYKSKYYFFTNNCGTETLKHISAALEGRDLTKISSFTPKKIFNDLLKKKDGLLEVDYDLNDRQDLVKKGYLFPSEYVTYDSAIKEIVKDSDLNVKIKNPKDFAKLSFELRREAFLKHFQAINENDHKTQLSIINRIILVETYVARIIGNELNAKLLKVNKASPQRTKETNEALRPMFLNPWDIIDSTYGIPSLDEVKDSLEKRKEELKSVMKTYSNQLQDIKAEARGNDKLTKDLNEEVGSQKIINDFLEKSKEIASSLKN